MSKLDELRRVLPAEAVRTDAEALGKYGRDWVRLREPRPSAVVFPSDTAETLAVVKWARATGTALVPSGGRTGLAGGALADAGQVVVSCERMDKVLGVSEVDRTITAQAGVVIRRVQEEAARHGLVYPIDFAPSDTMQVGGTIATNAGGVHVVRYGMTRAWVAGMVVVTGAGEVLDLSLAVPKNNTGYDLKQLFIGSEGTLGIVTEATLRLAVPPGGGGLSGGSSVALVAVADAAAMIECGTEARKHGTILAIEFWDSAGMELALAHLGRKAVPASGAWYVLAEFEGAGGAGEWAGACLRRRIAAERVDKEGEAAADLWAIRLSIGSAVAPFTPYKNDVCVPIVSLPAFTAALPGLLGGHGAGHRMVVWGHLGDGNLHINCLKPEWQGVEEFVGECQRIDEVLYPLVTRLGGSISAEHGIGVLKKHALHFTRSVAEIAAMRRIKGVFDPDGIMNPGKIFD